MRHHSLRDLRAELSIELRNSSGSNARYTDEEMSLALRRACAMLQEYFWLTATDSSKTFATDQYVYTYDYPVQNFEKVAFVNSNNFVKFSEEWWEPFPGQLEFLGNHDNGETIRVDYRRFPVPYPDDLELQDAITTTGSGIVGDSQIVSVLSAGDWPNSGWLKIDDEVMEIISIDRGIGGTVSHITATRGQLDTHPAAHAENAAVSFMNRVDKPVFFEGVKDAAIAYLNRINIIDSPAADIAGNVTIMREINEGMGMWIRRHRQRQMQQPVPKVNTARPFRNRTRGR